MLKTVEKTFAEYWGYYWRVVSRHQIPGIFEWDEKLVTLIEKTCGLTPGMKILDLACGGGDQAKVFAKRGYHVTGIDMVPSLVQYAKEQFEREGLTGEFLCGDMRDIAYENEFDCCLLLSGSFGFFDDRGNLEMLRKMHRALREGGKLFVMYVDTYEAYKEGSKRKRSWSEIDGGYSLTETWFDTLTCTRRSRVKHILNDGTVLVPAREQGYHADETIRCYCVPEMRELCRKAGFISEVFLSRTSIEKPDVPPGSGEAYSIVAAVKGRLEE